MPASLAEKESPRSRFPPFHFPPLPNKVAGSEKSGAPSPSECGARLHFSFVMSSFRYGVSEMQEMFRRLSSALPAGVDTDCPVVLSLPETFLEQDRPDGMYAALSWKSVVPALESRQDLTSKASKKRAMSSQKLPRSLVEQSSAVADGGAAVSPTSAPRSYASLVPRPHHIHFVHVCCRIHELTSCGSSSTAKRERAAARHPAERIFLPFGGISPV